MKLVTAEEMKNIDTVTIHKEGIPSLVLMERAGEAVAHRIEELFEKKRVVVVAGGGNNGGDGLVAGRILTNKGWDAKTLILGKRNRLSNDCLSQFKAAQEIGLRPEFRTGIKGTDLKNAVIVDSLFGTGLNKPIEGAILNAISVMNRSRSPVVSVDIPSGISSDTGQVMGKAVRADHTVTFGLPKMGHYLHPGAEFTGNLVVADIGFRKSLTSSEKLRVNLTDSHFVSGCIHKRPDDSHKGTYGHVFVIAGSAGKTGAALLASRAALRSGAGAVTLGVPDTLFGVYQTNVLEEMTVALPSGKKGTVSGSASSEAIDSINDRASVVLIGPGIGVNSDVKKFVREVVLNSEKPLVIDADGLNALADKPDVLKRAKGEVVVTPHPGEMKRLLSGKKSGLKTREINRRRVEIAETFAETFGVTCVLKGVPTVTASPGGEIFINPTGNPGMATAGSGDVLSGIIASFMAQGFGVMNSAVCGVYMHGLAGDIARDDIGEYSLVAGDIIEYLPDAFNALDGTGTDS